MADKFDEWNVKKTREDYPGRNIDAPDGDPYVDILESLDLEEMILAYRKGELDPARAPEYRDVFKFLQKLASYGGKGYLGLDSDGQYEQFITQKAVMMFQGSSMATRIAKDMADLPAGSKFEWGVFPYPDFEKTDTPYVDTPTRGSGGVGFKLAVAKSTPEREAAAIDFLRYILSPQNASIIVEQGEPIGPSAIKGVKGSAVFDAFAQVEGTSNWFYYLGLDSEGEDQYRRAFQEFLLGKMDINTFLRAYSDAVNGAHERQMEGIDLDPST